MQRHRWSPYSCNIPYVYICKHRPKYNTRADSVVQVRTVLLTSDFGSSTQGERHSILTMLTPSQRTAHLVVFKISVGRDPKNLTVAATVENSTLCPNGRNSIVYLHGPMSTFKSLSKSPNYQDHFFPAWHHPHSRLISCLGFIMTRVIVVSFAHERKTLPNDYALN